MILLKFKYVNWRGEDHEYLLKPEPESLTVHANKQSHWTISGRVIERDGKPHPHSDGIVRVRRTFELHKIRNLQEIER
jgi:hypothetical protein